MPKFAPLWRKWERKVLQPIHLAQVQKEEALSPQAKRAIQEKKLARILRNAYDRVPFYKEYFRGKPFPAGDAFQALQNFPILEKKQIQADSRRHVAENASMRGTVLWPTSGSSGMPLQILTNPSETAQNQALVRYGFLEAGVKPGHKIVKIRGITPASPNLVKAISDIFGWYAIDLKNTFERNIQLIEELKPDVLYSFPTYLQLFEQYVLDRGIKMRPMTAVASTGELVSPLLRELTPKVFGCQLRDMYGAAELHRIAYECGHQKMHVVESSVLMETMRAAGFSDDPAQEGDEILLTSLYHRTMPIIRYRIRDRVILSKTPCSCGRKGIAIEKLIGRQDDFLVLPSGRKIPPKAVNKLESVPGILEFQIVQKRRDLLEVTVHPSSKFTADSEKRIQTLIASGCEGETVQVVVNKVDRIPRDETGKLKTVLCEVL